ncbi:MAG TPA: DEAD/DEAH box helicase family protein [Candidatus Brocadiia bacterium]|nr:DEAD/DEAH box helicase family protein [Candidatus Brocadiia bacterium]
MPYQLKDYQQRCLDELARYLRRTVALDADTAFYEQTRRPYVDVKELPGLPYVCIRVPTGGGKTFMAAHAIGIAADSLLKVDKCLVLWLAPSTQIVEQTLRALRDRQHPYRQALDAAFNGCVTIMDLPAALNIQRSTLISDAVVIVSTIQAMRVENKEGRKIYDQNGQIMSCFDGIPEDQKGDGSLADLLRIRRPLMIVDEAHNARTTLSFDMLARFNPSCILEFTATPDQDPKGTPSNVLTHVSAAELKAEDMIKLPIRLRTRPQWKEAVAEALDKQKQLENLAKEEETDGGDYIRPIVLLQAQRQHKEKGVINYEALKKALMEDFSVSEDEIAIAALDKNELAGVDVLARDCKIRFIITVDKLREGWDCPFAYILCSVSNLRSSTAVEQILGRIMRLPHAKRKKRDDLNHAYAYVTSLEFAEAANALTDALVESGFERFEAQTLIRQEQGELMDTLPLWGGRTSEIVSIEPNLDSLPDELKAKVKIRREDEEIRVVYNGPPMTPDESRTLQTVFESKDDKTAVKRLYLKSRGEDASPSALGIPFRVPQLALRVGEQLELFEDQFREYEWKLSECDALLNDNEFSISNAPRGGVEVDVSEEGKVVRHSFVEVLQRQLSFLDIRGPKNEGELVLWLDRAIYHPDITPKESHLFIGRMILKLIRERDFKLEQLVLNRFRLRDAAERKISKHRSTAEAHAYNRTLFPVEESPLAVDASLSFIYPMKDYPATRFYEGSIRFDKHYYEHAAHMNDEEAECAALIDSLHEVKHWVKNVETRPEHSFWLQTATDKFYPDFVAELKDGRYLVVEYKGEGYMDKTDTHDKRIIGEVWEAKSGGRCVFKLVGKDDYEQTIRSAVSASR